MRLKIAILAGLVAVTVLAGSSEVEIFVPNCAINVTNSITSAKADGYIEMVTIQAPTLWTGTVVIASTWETVLTATDITQTNYYRVRVPVCDTVGTAYGMTTGGLERVFLSSDALTATVTSGSANTTNDVRVRVKTWQ